MDLPESFFLFNQFTSPLVVATSYYCHNYVAVIVLLVIIAHFAQLQLTLLFCNAGCPEYQLMTDVQVCH